MIELTPKQSAAFWERVDQSPGPDACWPWLGKTVDGYGRVAASDACAREGCGHAATAHDEGDWTCDDCDCEEYLAPSPATEAERRGGER